MRKVYVDLKFYLVLNANKDVDISDVVDELEYELIDTTGKATIEDTEIKDYEVIDSNEKVHLNLVIHMVINVDEGVEISEIVDELEYELIDTTGESIIEKTELIDYEITDSK